MTKIKHSHHVFTDAEAEAYRGSLRHLCYTRRASLVLLGTLLLVVSLFAVLGPTYGHAYVALVTVAIFLRRVLVSASARHGSSDPLAELDAPALQALAGTVKRHPEVRSWIHDAIASGKTLRVRDYSVACAQSYALDAKGDAARHQQNHKESKEEAKLALLAAAGLPDNREAAQQ